MKKTKLLVLFFLILSITAYTKNQMVFKPDFNIYAKDLISFSSDHEYFADSINNDFETQGTIQFLSKWYIPKFWINNILTYNGSGAFHYYDDITKNLIYVEIKELFYDTLSLGFDNIFLINNNINLTLGYHHFIIFHSYSIINFKFRPYLYFAAYLNSGISLKLETFFDFFYNPSTEEYNGYNYELLGSIGFEFMQFFVKKNSQKLFLNLYFEYNLLLENPIYSDYKNDKSSTHTFFAGLNASYYLFKPYFYSYFQRFDNEYEYKGEKMKDNTFHFGFKTGFELTKSWFTFGLDYIGSKDFIRNQYWINAVET
ncbi:MAG: hypothetical protein JXB50_06890, partial [Spirochaetes bacterium]|nr:hypothetical protein [Spirochaetota bacterium]